MQSPLRARPHSLLRRGWLLLRRLRLVMVLVGRERPLRGRLVRGEVALGWHGAIGARCRIQAVAAQCPAQI